MAENYSPSGTVSGTVVQRFTAAEAATGTFGTMDRATITELLDRTRYLSQTGQFINALTAYVGDSSNANSTLGLTINQGAADDEILTLKSSDVAHGVTDVTETDTFAAIRKQSATNGGVIVRGFTEATTAVDIQGIQTAADTTKSTAAVGAVQLTALLKSGTSTTDVGADGNLAVILNNNTCRFIFDVEGSGHADVAWTTF